MPRQLILVDSDIENVFRLVDLHVALHTSLHMYYCAEKGYTFRNAYRLRREFIHFTT